MRTKNRLVLFFKIVALWASLMVLFSVSLADNKLDPNQWINIDYSNLVDKEIILRTGQNLGSALTNSHLKGSLQPFLDHYSYLLEYAVELLHHENIEFENVVDKYPIGAEQPAWVALFRSGGLSAFTDRKKTVRLFLHGNEPQLAYNKNYSIVRHMLNSLKPNWGKLYIEIYAFENDYQTLSLKLNPNPAIISSGWFGTPAGKIPLDLSGLTDFFDNGGQLEGAKINEKIGLQLYARATTAQTLGGKKLQLSDFAVAYRAVFHAGYNKAFISLDAHKDVTKATVNFGGFLHDTFIGKVVLEADKRFKTITSGLDPTIGKDIRADTRQYVPNFLTASERDMLAEEPKNGWIKTRFWFYPDSIEVQTDQTNHFAKIIKPYFLADAERSRDDFSSSAEYDKKKKAFLLPAIKENIDELNAHYDEYAKAFPEFRELITVGRLMAICSWLNKVNPQWLDLDALLAVKIPAITTERERTQLIAFATLSTGNYDKNPDTIKKNLIIHYLSPDLDASLMNYFSNKNELANFLAFKIGQNENPIPFLPKAESLLKNQGNQPVRMLLKTQQDLQSFAIYSGHRKQPVVNARVQYQHLAEENKILDLKQKELSDLGQKINEFRTKITQETLTSDSNLIRHNALVEEMNSGIKTYHVRKDKFNQHVRIYNENLKNSSPQLVEIGGGINLEAESFKIKTVESSPQLSSFKNIITRAKPEWSNMDNHEKWITNKVNISKAPVSTMTVFNTPAVQKSVHKRQPPLPKSEKSMNSSPLTLIPNKVDFLDKAKLKKQIFIRSDNNNSSQIKGEFVDLGHIVFTRVPK